MSTVFQCDWCSKTSQFKTDWIVIDPQDARNPHAMIGDIEFCTWRCLREYAYKKEKENVG